MLFFRAGFVRKYGNKCRTAHTFSWAMNTQVLALLMNCSSPVCQKKFPETYDFAANSNHENDIEFNE
jgi:hypothetical protein